MLEGLIIGQFGTFADKLHSTSEQWASAKDITVRSRAPRAAPEITRTMLSALFWRFTGDRSLVSALVIEGLRDRRVTGPWRGLESRSAQSSYCLLMDT